MYPSIYPSTGSLDLMYLYNYLFIDLFMYLCIYLSIYLFIYLSIYITFWRHPRDLLTCPVRICPQSASKCGTRSGRRYRSCKYSLIGVKYTTFLGVWTPFTMINLGRPHLGHFVRCACLYVLLVSGMCLQSQYAMQSLGQMSIRWIVCSWCFWMSPLAVLNVTSSTANVNRRSLFHMSSDAASVTLLVHIQSSITTSTSNELSLESILSSSSSPCGRWSNNPTRSSSLSESSSITWSSSSDPAHWRPALALAIAGVGTECIVLYIHRHTRVRARERWTICRRCRTICLRCRTNMS